MRKLLLLVACLVMVNCGSKDKEITLSFTSPQGLTISYEGYYLTEPDNDSVPLVGVTNRDYRITLTKGEGISGSVAKDWSNFTDTLHFCLLDGDDTLASQKTTLPTQVIQFQVTAE